MSNLIIMPSDAPEMEPSSLIGRTLTLNWTVVGKYQSFKFYLGKARPLAQVPPDADLVDLRNAVLKGTLIDVTDQHLTGIDLGGDGSMSPVAISEIPGKYKVFIGSEKSEGPVLNSKQLFVAIPRDDAEERSFLAETKAKGRIDGIYQPRIPEAIFSPISVMDIEDRPLIQNDESFGTLIKKAFRRLIKDIRTWWSK